MEFIFYLELFTQTLFTNYKNKSLHFEIKFFLILCCFPVFFSQLITHSEVEQHLKSHFQDETNFISLSPGNLTPGDNFYLGCSVFH